MRTLLVAAAIAGLLLGQVPPAAAEGPGVLKGKVQNKTPGGAGVSNITLTLHTYLNDTEQSAAGATTTTDAQGNFTFSGLNTDPSYSYEITIDDYQGAQYTGSTVTFAKDETQKSADMTVWDSTTSDAAISVDISHIVISPQQGSLMIMEFYNFKNSGDKSYVGTKQVTPDGLKETLRFTLPPEATEIEYGMGLMDCCVVINQGALLDTMAVEPGIKEISFAYRVNYSGGTYNLARTLDYPMDTINVLIEGEGVKVSSENLTSRGQIDIEGTPFFYLAGEQLARNARISTSLSGLPEGSIQGKLLWAGAGLAAVAVLLAVGYPALRRRSLPQPALARGPGPRRTGNREALIEEIARLDDDFEGGSLPAEQYQRLRSQKKAQLLELTRRTQGG